MRTTIIETLKDLNEPITSGGKLIPKGTVMTFSHSYLLWNYFTDGKQTLLLRGFVCDFKDEVKALN